MSSPPPQLSKLIHLTDDELLVCQQDCEDDLLDTLDALASLVLHTQMPTAERRWLRTGIDHLRGHIRCETASMEGEIKDRRN